MVEPIQPGGVRRALVVAPYRAEARERLARLFAPAEVVFARGPSDAPARAALATAEVVVLDRPPVPAVLEAPRLRWLHYTHSGCERLARPEILSRPFVVTGGAGRSSEALAEHALFFMLALAADAPSFARAQRRRVWGVRGQDRLLSLVGRRVLIVGWGGIARALAPRCRALGLAVDVLRRRAGETAPDGVRLFSAERGDTLPAVVGEADVVVLAAALNDATHAMLDTAAFARMKPGALLVNVARAGLVDRAALLAALRSGRLGGAGLDVAHCEPLPPWDALWRAPNVILTPHTTPRVADRERAEIDIVAENHARLRDGRPLLNRLTEADLYTKALPDPSLATRLACRAWRLALSPRATPR